MHKTGFLMPACISFIEFWLVPCNHCSVQSLSRVWLFETHGLQHTRPPCPSPTPRIYSNPRPLRRGDATQPPHPLSSPSPAFNLSLHQGLFKWISSLYQVAKVLEFQLQHQFFPWIFRIDFLRIDWFDPLAAQGTLKSLLQHHSSKASVLRCSAFFIVQLSHPYLTTVKTIALTRWIFVI